MIKLIGVFIRRHGIFLIPIFIVALVILRAYQIDNIFGNYVGCKGCFIFPSLMHDTWLIAFVLILCGVSYCTKRYWLQLPFSLIAITVLILVILDLILIKTLTTRLYIPDISRFAFEPAAITSVVQDVLKHMLKTKHGLAMLIVGALVGIFAIPIALRPRPRHLKLAGFYGVIAGILCGMASFSPGANIPPYVGIETFQNLFEVNYGTGLFKSYSPNFKAKLEKEIKPLSLTCEAGLNRQPNIILVVVESLSAYQSKLLGGSLDATPELDKISLENSYFTNFIANGFTTDGGLISLINGRVPTYPTTRDFSDMVFFGFDNPHHSLIEILHESGYSTHFFGAFDLDFIHTGTWLDRIGFDSKEGHENPYYASWSPGQFGSAPDQALFERTLAWLNMPQETQPFFNMLLTISGHPPFAHPVTGKFDEIEVFHYVDEQLSRFYKKLSERHFFDNGILLITGDHRSMTPLHTEEIKRYGDFAYVRIPLIIAGQSHLPKTAIADKFQQTDLISSLEYLTKLIACRHFGQGSFLRSDPRPAEFALHVRGDQRNRVDVFLMANRVA